MTDIGFQKATSNNLPMIDATMVAEFFHKNENFGGAEMRGVKAGRSARESYGDSAIGYVQVRRLRSKCSVKARVSPEHRVRSKAYVVILTVDEGEQVIDTVECQDCAAAAGGCKHAIAFLMWLHRRSEDPAPTEVTCYWQKAKLSRVGTTLKFITTSDISGSTVTPLPVEGNFLQEFVDLSLSKENTTSQVIKHFIPPAGPETLSIHQLLVRYRGDPKADAFISFCSEEMPTSLCDVASRASRNQSNSKLWYELRHARITASKLYEAANCKKMQGSLVEVILGAKHIDTPAMERGRLLEDEVLDVVSKDMGLNIQKTGLLLNSLFPIFGASPDGITDSAVVEVKCPLTKRTFETYVKNGNVGQKHLAQMHLQMLLAAKREALFCVAHPDFTESKKVEVVKVNFDTNFLNSVLTKAQKFWENAIFPMLMESMARSQQVRG